MSKSSRDNSEDFADVVAVKQLSCAAQRYAVSKAPRLVCAGVAATMVLGWPCLSAKMLIRKIDLSHGLGTAARCVRTGYTGW